MVRWLLARLGRAAGAAWLIASLVFIGSRQLRGGPEQLALADASDLSRPVAPGTQTAATQQAARQAVRQRLGLAQPVFYATREAGQWHWHGTANEYHSWAVAALHGDLGYSYRDGQPVAGLLAQALRYTLPLAASAAGLAVGLALVLGLYLARAPSSWGQRVVFSLLSGLQITPLFLLALVLLLLFANPEFLNLLPAAGQAPAADRGGQLAAYWLGRSALPLLSLVLAVLPELTLPLAARLRQEATSGYATTARAKGLATGQMLRRHALPNALIPLLTTLTDLLPALVAGTVIVEVLFALPGSGRLLAEAAAAHDYPLVVAGVLLTAAARLLGLLLADVLYFLVDPRLRPAT
jgi:peptide/nickel transport system permease protein